MDISTATKILKCYIAEEFAKTKNTIRANLHRGHLRALSTEIEDGIAAFLLDIIGEGYKVYVDATVRVGGKTHRPDILVVDVNNQVKALVEVKTNMGWCRDASGEIGKILHKHGEMVSNGKIVCKFSNDKTVEAIYTNDVSVFLVSFTDENCGTGRHESNRRTAEEKGINYYCLFSGWYGDELQDSGIKEFADKIVGLCC